MEGFFGVLHRFKKIIYTKVYKFLWLKNVCGIKLHVYMKIDVYGR